MAVDFELEYFEDIAYELTKEEFLEFYREYVKYIRDFTDSREPNYTLMNQRVYLLITQLHNDYFTSDKFWKDLTKEQTFDVINFVEETIQNDFDECFNGETPISMLEYFNVDYQKKKE